MTILSAVTKKMRNLHRIDKAYRTVMNHAIYRRDLERAMKARKQQKRLLADVLRIFVADCEAAK